MSESKILDELKKSFDKYDGLLGLEECHETREANRLIASDGDIEYRLLYLFHTPRWCEPNEPSPNDPVYILGLFPRE